MKKNLKKILELHTQNGTSLRSLVREELGLEIIELGYYRKSTVYKIGDKIYYTIKNTHGNGGNEYWKLKELDTKHHNKIKD